MNIRHPRYLANLALKDASFRVFRYSRPHRAVGASTYFESPYIHIHLVFGAHCKSYGWPSNVATIPKLSTLCGSSTRAFRQPKNHCHPALGLYAACARVARTSGAAFDELERDTDGTRAPPLTPLVATLGFGDRLPRRLRELQIERRCLPMFVWHLVFNGDEAQSTSAMQELGGRVYLTTSRKITEELYSRVYAAWLPLLDSI